MKYDEIQEIMKDWLGKIYNLEGIEPLAWGHPPQII